LTVIAGRGSGDGAAECVLQPTPAMPKTEAAADERDTLAVISRLLVAQRLCDNAECCKPLQTVLQCAKCKDASYCSKDCQVCPHHHTLFLQEQLKGIIIICALSRALAQATGMHAPGTRTVERGASMAAQGRRAVQQATGMTAEQRRLLAKFWLAYPLRCRGY
jgi:RNA polymerase subunit RPABC4/transcription elongation factor Spt4